MRVKHKDAPKHLSDTSMALCHWHEHYLPNKKYLNYDFYDVPEIFDLFEIDEKTGNLVYVKSDFASIVHVKRRENPKKYLYKPHNEKYLDKYLMPTKLAVQLSSELKKNTSNNPQSIKTKAIAVSRFNIKDSALIFWKLISENKLVSGVVLFIVLYIIKKVFNIS